jgi:hypothetical protein
MNGRQPSGRAPDGAGTGLGVIMLCHAPLHRATEVARHWARADVPVAIHIDAQSPEADAAAMRAALGDLPAVTFVSRQRSDWGSWGLVAATLAAAEALLARHPGLGHVMLTSGACLPLRPVPELHAHLAAHPDCDFIEALPLGQARWTQGGLEAERFTLHFPVSWRRHRRLFDLLVRGQRALGIARRIPAAIRPYLGLQWWCLTGATLAAILRTPDRAALERYFRGVWIPDESFFQTLAARHARQIAPPLTFQRFDTRGKPHVLYDDHLEMLAACPAFVARKIWPGAEALYRAFLDAPEATRATATAAPDALVRTIAAAHRLRREGRVGLRSMGRLPDPSLGLPPTAAPYGVFWGVAALMPGFADWLVRATAEADVAVHGRLFAPTGAQFAGGAAIGPGALSAEAALRDYAPTDFLSNLVWATRGQRQILLADAEDGVRLALALAGDVHARGLVVTGTDIAPAALAAEAEGLALLGATGARHGLRILSMAAFNADPEAHLAKALADILGDPDPADPLAELRAIAPAPRPPWPAGPLPPLPPPRPIPLAAPLAAPFAAPAGARPR